VLAILVDLDGTIVNSAPGIIGSYQHALRCMGAECPSADDLRWVLGPPSRRSFPKLIRPDQDVEEAVRLYREHYEANGLFNGAVYPGMREALTTLHALPARLFVCTAKPQGFAEKIIAHFGLAHLFDGIYGVDLEGRLDDKGLLIEQHLRTEQIDLVRTIMVGDRATTCSQHPATAFPAVGALWGYGDADELRSVGATVLCPSPDDLVEMVQSLQRV
jgi:phosphoglycolate phosphatase